MLSIQRTMRSFTSQTLLGSFGATLSLRAKIWSKAQNFTSVQHDLTTMCLLGCRCDDFKQAPYRLLYWSRSFTNAKDLRCIIAHVRLNEARLQDKSIEPFVLGVNSDTVPVYQNLRWPIRSIRDWWLSSTISLLISLSSSSIEHWWLTQVRRPQNQWWRI